MANRGKAKDTTRKTSFPNEARSSAEYRAEGNKLFASSDVDGSMQILNTKEAIKMYNKALNCSINRDDQCSALKNIAVASQKVGNLLRSQEKPGRERQYYFRESIVHFDAAYSLTDCKSPAWREDLLARFQQSVQDATMDVQSLDHYERVAALEELSRRMKNAHFLRGELLIEIVSVRFHEGVTALHFKDYKRCLKEMHECYQPCEEAKKYGRDYEYILAEIKLREEDVYLTRCIAESTQARTTGDNLLEKLLNDEENLNMDMAWEVVDFYRQAILLTREVDVEGEAIAYSRLGRVFDKVLKIKFKAKEILEKSIQLAVSMHPRKFDTEDWYQECCATIDRYKKESVQQEAVKWNNERMVYVMQMQNEIKKLTDLHKNPVNFLKFVYSKYPPKDDKKKLGDLPDQLADDHKKKMIALLRKAIMHYHPDHADIEKNGKKWKVLCEEVTKLLTAIYESYKDGNPRKIV